MLPRSIRYIASAGSPRRLTAAHQIWGELGCKVLILIKKVSPAAWRHVHLNGHDTFRGSGQVIDLDAIVAGLDLA